MLEAMELRLVREKDILFFEEDKVYVIISGNILMKNHDKNYLLPLTCAKFGEGDILNFMQEKTALFNSILRKVSLLVTSSWSNPTPFQVFRYNMERNLLS